MPSTNPPFTSRPVVALACVISVALVLITGVGPAAAVPANGVTPAVHERYVSSYHDATTLEELQFAPDFKREHADLLRLYRAFFDREPDVAGSIYWLDTWDRAKAEGVTARRPDGHDYLGEFTGYFTQAQEYANNYEGVDNATFLDRVYRNMLDREPDPEGYDYWLSLLEGTNPDKPGRTLSRANAVRWITQNVEFIDKFPYGHTDWSDHPSDLADCTTQNVGAFDLSITGIYRLRDGAIRELCYGWRDENVEEAWTRMIAVADPVHFGPVALLGIYEGTGSGIVAYAGPAFGVDNAYIGDLWLISAQDAATDLYPDEADLTMVHELTHVFTQLDNQIDFASPAGGTDCAPRFEFSETLCFTAESYLDQWVQSFWSPEELAVYRDDEVANTTLCVEGHDFTGSYATTSPQEDFAESFSAYVYGVDLANQAAKFAWFDGFPELSAYKDRAVTLGLIDYPNTFGSCP